MNQPTQLSVEQRRNLVAYLDGELDEEATQAMERLLAESPEARHEVDMLARTFALLDSLPRPGASADFSARTLATLRAEAPPSSWTEKRWYHIARNGAVAGVWVVGLVLAALLGYSAARGLVPSTEERLIRELPVIENLDTYSDVGRIELLEELHQHKVFDESDTASQP